MQACLFLPLGTWATPRASGKSKTTITILVIFAPKYFSSTIDLSFFFFFFCNVCIFPEEHICYTNNSPVSLVPVQMTLSFCLHTGKAKGREKESEGLNQTGWKGGCVREPEAPGAGLCGGGLPGGGDCLTLAHPSWETPWQRKSLLCLTLTSASCSCRQRLPGKSRAPVPGASCLPPSFHPEGTRTRSSYEKSRF